jgi:hypothetical protein
MRSETCKPYSRNAVAFAGFSTFRKKPFFVPELREYPRDLSSCLLGGQARLRRILGAFAYDIRYILFADGQGGHSRRKDYRNLCPLFDLEHSKKRQS